jgi:branched-subunit amino acid transport protein
MRWLSYVPVAVMGALLATETLIPALEAANGVGDGRTPPFVPLYLSPGIYGALAAMLAYRFSKSFIGSTVAGVFVYALIQWLVGL